MQTSPKSFRSALLSVLLCMLPGASPLFGQGGTTGTIAVTVHDPTGAAVPAAELDLIDISTNEARKAQTQQAGEYTFPNLPFGSYRLTINVNGFRREVFESVQVQTARVTEVNATLQLGGTAEADVRVGGEGNTDGRGRRVGVGPGLARVRRARGER